MDLFLESPLAVIGVGLAIVAMLGVSWVNSGHSGFLYGTVAAVVLTIAMVIVSQLVTTDREAIEQTLREITAYVEANDAKQVPRYVAGSAPDLAQAGQAEMARHTFAECRVTRVHEIVFKEGAKPPTATVKFNAYVKGDLMKGSLPEFATVRGFTIVMEKEADGRWRVRSYEHYDPTAFMREEPPISPSLP